VKLVTSAQMRTLEQAAVAAGTSLDTLMENAGLAVAQEAWLQLGVVAGRRVLVLVGPGNNGGDGLVCARHLADWEADVLVYLLRPRPDDDPKLAAVRALDVPVIAAPDDVGYKRLRAALDGAELVVDALLGTGPQRPPEGDLAAILGHLREARERPRPPHVIAVDLPSGVDADTGRAHGLAVYADTTVTLGFAKVGLYMLPGSEHAGRVEVVDIGLPPDAARDVATELIDNRWTKECLPARPKDANKGTFGKLLVVGGSADYTGAVRLAAEAAYRAGAGLVAVAAPDPVRAAVSVALPEAVYVPLACEHALDSAAAATVREALAAYDVLLIGPGLSQAAGVRDAAVDIVRTLPDALRAFVVDADALNALAAAADWPSLLVRPGTAVLTPHPGEMARLTRTSVAEVQADRLGVATRAAHEWRQVVVLKGAHTVVAAPDGRVAISPHANPLLATAGTGDVLAGAIAGLLAQGAEPFEAAACAVHLHALAAEDAAEAHDLADRGLLASDLLPALPRAIRTVLRGKRAKPAGTPLNPFGDLSALTNLPGLGAFSPPQA